MPTPLTNEKLAGQRLMIGFNGTDLNEELKKLIAGLQLGGIILFSRNIESPEQIKELCLSAQSYAKSCGLPPLFIAVDQEGGQVARLKEPFTIFPGNPHMKSEDDAVNFAKITAKELKSVGINMDMAPVLDIAPKDMQSIMAGRAFGDNPEWVSRLGLTVIEGLQQNNIIAVAKHFPGIGRTILDSHLELPFMNADIESIKSFDLIPFIHAVKKGVCGMMLSHILYENIDAELPASLSVKIAKDLLRNELNFEGIVITDDLDMGAVEKHYDIKNMIKQILAADIDITLICHAGSKIKTAWQEMVKSFKDSAEMRLAAEHSVERMLKIKRLYCSQNFELLQSLKI
jgi:beta-N-acetylhexosaminidase